MRGATVWTVSPRYGPKGVYLNGPTAQPGESQIQRFRRRERWLAPRTTADCEGVLAFAVVLCTAHGIVCTTHRELAVALVRAVDNCCV